MKIDRIALTNFRSHAATNLNLTRINVIRGANGVGKSSIEQAIQLALSGTCEGLTASGAGSANLIRTGAEKAEIILATSHGDRKVTITPAGKATKDREWTAKHRDLVFACVTNTRYFLSLTQAKQSEVLASLILPPSMTLEPKVAEAMDAVGIVCDLTIPPFQFIEQAYKAAFEARRDVNRDLKNWRPIAYTAPAEGGTVAEIRARLKERQDELASLKAKRHTAVESSNANADRKARAGAAYDIKKQRLETEQRILNDANKQVLPKAKVAELKKVAANKARAVELDAIILEQQAEVRRLQAHAKQLTDKLEDATNCPTCNQLITEEVAQALVAPLAMNIDKAIEIERGSIDARKALGDPEAASRELRVHEQALQDADRSRARIAELEKDIAELEHDRNLVIEIVDTSSIDQQIADLERRLEKGNQAYGEALNNENRKKEYTENQKLKAELERSKQHLEFLVERFSPTGIKAEMLNESIGGFEQRVNQVLHAFGYEAHLRFEPYEFRVTRDGMKGDLELLMLSKSQQMRFAVAFQVALALWSGVKMVVIDETDMLDAAGRSALMRTLVGLQGLDQAICIGTDERTNVPDAPGLSVFYISTGDDLVSEVNLLGRPVAA